MIRSSLFLISLIAFLHPPLGAETRRGALVVGVVGSWTDGANKRIHFGDSLADVTDVICDTGSLTLLLPRAANRPVSLKCESSGARTNIGNFEEAHPLQGKLNEFVSQFFDVVSLKLSHEPETYIAAVSRGFGNTELDESVLLLAGGKLDVSSAFASAPAGEYAIALFPLTDDTPDPGETNVHWQPGTPTLVSIPNLHPGLMKITLISEGSPTSIIWTLLADRDHYPFLEKHFEEALGIVSKWPGGVHAQASRSVLRAYLNALSAGDDSPR